MSDEMETTMLCLYDNKVPPTWVKKAYPSMRPLAGWVDNLRDRVKQLADWAGEVVVPTEVTKKTPEEVEGPSREGSYVHGLIMEGARWDTGLNSIDDSKMKEMFCQMPVMLVKAVQVEKAEYKEQYMCPVYKTQARNGIMQ